LVILVQKVVGCSHNPMSQKGHRITKKKKKIGEIFMFTI